MRGVTFVDVAGAELLAQEARRRRKMGGGLYFYSCKDATVDFLRRSGAMNEIGEKSFFPVMSDWAKPIYEKLDSEICRNCKARIFAECQEKLPNGQARSPHLNPLPHAGEDASVKCNV